MDQERGTPLDLTPGDSVLADLTRLPGIASRKSGRALGAGPVSAEADVEDGVLLPAADTELLEDVVDARPLVEVRRDRIRQGAAVADARISWRNHAAACSVFR